MATVTVGTLVTNNNVSSFNSINSKMFRIKTWRKILMNTSVVHWQRLNASGLEFKKKRKKYSLKEQPVNG